MKEIIIFCQAYLAYTKFSEGRPAAAPVSNTPGQTNQIAIGEPNGGGYSVGGVDEPSGGGSVVRSIFDTADQIFGGNQNAGSIGGSIFDDIFGQAAQSTPTYRNEYPMPPGVIDAGGYEPIHDEPVYGGGGGTGRAWSIDDPYGLIEPFYDY